MKSYELQPIDNWFLHCPNGDIVLCDPFTGQAFKENATDPDTVPPVFAEDEEAGRGYTHLQTAEAESNGRFQLKLVLVDPTDTESLATYSDELEEHMREADCVGYTTRRSINKQGLLTDELYRAPYVLLGDPFVKAMGAMASKVERPLFSYDPPVDFDGKPSSPAAQRLVEVETAVLDWAWAQEDPTNPDHSVMGCDLVYTRMLGSLLNSQVGHKTHELRKGGPKRPEKVVLFGAPELAGMQYEVKSLGVYAEAVPLYSRLVHSDADSKPDPDFHIYPGFIKDGAISAEFFEGSDES